MQPSPDTATSLYIPPEINIADQQYNFVAVRTTDPTAGIYRSSAGDAYLKTRPDRSTDIDGIQTQLAERGFPVPGIIGRGVLQLSKIGGVPYIVEEAAGDTFAEAIECGATPKDDSFDAYISATLHWLNAQLVHPESAALLPDRDGFFAAELTEEILAEVGSEVAEPAIERLEAVWRTARERLGALPIACNQGDLNPRNVTWLKRVIDFEYALRAPVGYDAVNALFHAYMFPQRGSTYETYRTHEFTEEQIERALHRLDHTLQTHGHPGLRKYIDDFIIGKLIWSAGGEEQRPHLRGWRWRLLSLALDRYDPAHPGQVANLLVNQRTAIDEHRGAVVQDFQQLVSEIFADNLIYAFIAGRFADELWVGPTRDIDMLVTIRSPNERQLNDFRERYLKLHLKHFYSPDRTYPGEVTTASTIEQRMYLALHAPPTPRIPLGQEHIYDGIVWAGMLKHPSIAFMGSEESFSAHRDLAITLRNAWHQTLARQGRTPETLNDERHAITYEGDH